MNALSHFQIRQLFLLSQPFYLHRAHLFYSHRHDGRAPRTFYSLVLLRIAGQFYCTTVQTQPQGRAGRNHRECSHFSEHIRFPSLSCYFWVSHGDESSYELTPSELLKSKKIVGYTSARHKIQYFVLPCLGVLRLCQNPLLSESLRTAEK